MMPKHFRTCTWVALIALAAGLWVLPAPASAQRTNTLSAGVGEEGRMPQAGYSVRFEFAHISGAYLANVSVLVTDAAGTKMIETVSEGPWLYADLKPGDYNIVATAQSGAKQGATFSVEPGQSRVIRLAWR